MPHRHALELVPDGGGDQAVRRDWEALSASGLPSQLDHPGSTHTPHVTVLSTPAISEGTANLARVLLEPLLPIRVRASGILILGGDRVTVARALDVEDEVIRAVLDVRAIADGRLDAGWLPHVTVARRVERRDVQRAVDALGYQDTVIDLVELRRWDPDSQTVETLATVE